MRGHGGRVCNGMAQSLGSQLFYIVLRIKALKTLIWALLILRLTGSWGFIWDINFKKISRFEFNVSMAQVLEGQYKQMLVITHSYITALILSTFGCSLDVHISNVSVLFP